jgi:hypothetical protein
VQFRQGDVFIEKVDSIPDGVDEVPREEGSVVLAHGEATGHRHQISDTGATLFVGKDKAANQDRFLRVLRPVSLRHEEHAKIDLTPGLYRVRRQREWSDSDEPRVVAD